MMYPNRRLLVSVEWLREHLDDEAVVVLDVRAGDSRAAYDAGHVTGSLPFSLPYARGLVDGAPDCLVESALVRQLSRLGISAEQTLVLYDDSYSTTLTYTFWALERVGHPVVRVLEGGFDAWCKASGTTTLEPSCYEPCTYAPAPRDTCLATADWVLQHGSEVLLLDTRGKQEWRAGRIAGARHCEWRTFVHEESGRAALLPGSAVEKKLEALNAAPEQEAVTYCRTGARASFVYFILRLMGWKQVRTYDGSMTDWLLREYPVERS